MTTVSIASRSAARLTRIRQYEKYEHTRADASAALASGRWRLAVLSARAAVGFLIDVTVADDAHPSRDELHRLGTAARWPGTSGERAELRTLLTASIADEAGAAEYLSACWAFVDNVVRPELLGVPPYYSSDDRSAHVELRRQWLVLANEAGSVVAFSPHAVPQLVDGDGAGAREVGRHS